MKGLVLTIAFVLLLSSLAIGQTPSPTPAFRTTSVDEKPICMLRAEFDNYKKVSWNEERARLDALLISANNYTGSLIFLEVQVPAKDSLASVKRRALKMVNHLRSRDKSFTPERLVIALRRAKEHHVIAYISPIDVELPECKDGCIQFTGKDLLP